MERMKTDYYFMIINFALAGLVESSYLSKAQKSEFYDRLRAMINRNKLAKGEIIKIKQSGVIYRSHKKWKTK